MKRLLFVTISAALVFAAGCAKDTIREVALAPDGFKTIEFNVSIEDSGTKAWLDGLSVRWTDGDKVAVFDGISAEPNEFTVYNASGKTATISGTVSDGATEFCAVYPFSAAKSRTASGVDISLGQYQTIPSGKNVDPEALISVALSSGGSMLFRNVVSLVAFDIATDDVNSVTFYGNAEELITGGGEVNLTGNDPVASATGSSYVSVSAQGGSPFSRGRYYAVVLPAEFGSGVSFATTTAGGKYLRTSSNKAVLPINGGVSFGKMDSGTELPMSIGSKAELRTWADNINAYVRGDVVKLTADIDWGGEEWTPLPGRCSLDGQGHSIYNFVITSSLHPEIDRLGLFQTLNDDNVVKNLKLGCNPAREYDGTSALVVDSAAETYYAGTLAGVIRNNKGSDKIQVSDVVSYVPVTMTLPSAATMSFKAGGIAGYVSSGTPVEITGCKNYGDVKNASAAKMTGNIYMGGIVGHLSCSGTILENCSNYGEVNLSSKAKGEIGTSFAGGIVGRIASVDGVVVSGCSNEGKVNVGINVKAAHYIGGIVGMDHQPVASGSYNVTIDGCTNAGEVGAGSESKSGYYGGIIGCTMSRVLITDCDNLSTGSIFKKNNHTSESAYGGIIGRASGCDGALVTGCTNAADLVESGSVTNASEVYHAFGGIAGIGNIDIVNCSNSGSITVSYTANTTLHCAGGIAGLHEGYAMTGCTNTGALSTTLNCPTGGLIGLQLDASLTTGEGCAVNCDITAGQDSTCGMLVGVYSGTSALTIGSSSNPVNVAGTINGAAASKSRLCGSASATQPTFNTNL